MLIFVVGQYACASQPANNELNSAKYSNPVRSGKGSLDSQIGADGTRKSLSYRDPTLHYFILEGEQQKTATSK
jgi:hypothetical protein